MSVKASFDMIYTQYSPKAYIEAVIVGLQYRLPFFIVREIKKIRASLFGQNVVRTTILGSCHGLEAASLRYDFAPVEIIDRWRNAEVMTTPFSKPTTYEVTLVDIEPEPLRFASDVGLCEHRFVADMCCPYSQELTHHLKTETDLLIAVGVAYYIGVEGVERLLETAFTNSQTSLFCFSIPKYLDPDVFTMLCRKYGLSIQTIGFNLPQRLYRSAEEKEMICTLLKSKNLYSSGDDTALRCHVYFATKPPWP